MSNANSQADEHLLVLIRSGDQDGWAQFVSRYQGRMIAFARRQIGDNDAEDLVQESLIGFLRSLESYRGESGLESWLFRILRRRIIDYYRHRGSQREFTAYSFDAHEQHGSGDPLIINLEDSGGSPSVYLRREEQDTDDEANLSAALNSVVERLHSQQKLRELMIIEGLFYAGIKNRRLAELVDVDERQVALIRHRTLKRMKAVIDESDAAIGDEDFRVMSDLLTRVWERSRPSCLKRTTIGKSLIGILNPEWQDYITYHVDTLGCRYCHANRDDLALPTGNGGDRSTPAIKRIFESTIGFMKAEHE